MLECPAASPYHKVKTDQIYQLNNVRFLTVDDGIDTGVWEREVVLDHVHFALAVDVDGGLEVAAGQGLDGDVDVLTLDLDEQIPGADCSALKSKKLTMKHNLSGIVE